MPFPIRSFLRGHFGGNYTKYQTNGSSMNGSSSVISGIWPSAASGGTPSTFRRRKSRKDNLEKTVDILDRKGSAPAQL